MTGGSTYGDGARMFMAYAKVVAERDELVRRLAEATAQRDALIVAALLDPNVAAERLIDLLSRGTTRTHAALDCAIAAERELRRVP